MLGALRLMLALMVVMNHLWAPTANKVGANAVVGFYTISGYLMTKVIVEVYCGYGGWLRYLANRCLRIYPMYLVVLAISVVCLIADPKHFVGINRAMQLPDTFEAWVRNVTLWDMIYFETRLIPPSWSLSVELIFYLLIGIGISRTPLCAAIWWVTSLIISVHLLVDERPFGERYTPPWAASAFFSTGAMVYFFGDRFRRWQTNHLVAVLIAPIFAVWPLAIERIDGDPHMEGYYGAYVLFLALLLLAINTRKERETQAIDKFLGDLAYPVFLTHYLAAGITNVIVDNSLAPKSTLHFLASTVVCLALSAVLVVTVDRSVSAWRDRIRMLAQEHPKN